MKKIDIKKYLESTNVFVQNPYKNIYIKNIIQISEERLSSFLNNLTLEMNKLKININEYDSISESLFNIIDKSIGNIDILLENELSKVVYHSISKDKNDIYLEKIKGDGFSFSEIHNGWIIK